MAQTRLDIIIEAIDRASKPLREITGKLGKISRVGQGLQQAGKQISTAITLPLVAAGAAAGKFAIDLEEAMAGVRKSAGLTAEETAAMTDQILKLSRDIPIAATGLAAIAEAGGQLGIAKNDIAEFVELTAQMGIAFDISADRAGGAIAKLKNVFGLTIPQVESLGDAINVLSNNSAASAADIVEAVGRVGGTADTFGLTAAQTAALTSSFIAMGSAPEMVSTALGTMLPLLQTAASQTPKFKRGLDLLGISAQDLQSAIELDAVGALQMFIGQLEKLDKTQRALALQQLFGAGADVRLMANLANNSSLLGDALELVADQGKIAGSIQEEFGVKSETSFNKIAILRNSLVELAVSIGRIFLPNISRGIVGLSEIVWRTTDWINANKGLVKVAGTFAAIAAVVGPTVFVIGSLISTLSTIWGWIVAIKGAMLVAGPVIAAVMAVISTPIVATIALVAGLGVAAYRLISNWDVVGPFFGNLWKRIVSFFQSGTVQAIASFVSLHTGVLGQMHRLGMAMFNAGRFIITQLINGIKSMVGAVGEAIGNIAQRIRDMLPGSPVRLGPLRALNSISNNPGAKIAQMVAAGIQAGSPAIGAAMGGGVGGAVIGGGGFGPVAMTVNVSGVGTREEAAAVAEVFEERVAAALASITRNQGRVTYG